MRTQILHSNWRWYSESKSREEDEIDDVDEKVGVVKISSHVVPFPSQETSG